MMAVRDSLFYTLVQLKQVFSFVLFCFEKNPI